MISTVHAYRDDGSMSTLTKWKPRRVECTRTTNHQDLPGRIFVVKYAREQKGCACVISELVCTQLLAKLGLLTLIPHIVEITPGFATSCNLKSDFPYKIAAGKHFSTLLLTDVENGPPDALNNLNSPWHLIVLWIADTWLGNIDRQNEGNTLLRHVDGGKFDIIAADQSDCFGGTDLFCSGSFQDRFAKLNGAPAPSCLTAAIASLGGRSAVTRAITQVQKLSYEGAGVISTVPQDWWNRAEIQPSTVSRALLTRSSNLESIINPKQWELPDDVLF